MFAYISIIITLPVLSNCIRVNRLPTDAIKSKTKVELSAVIITCKLSEILVISAPIVDPRAVYFIYKPNGDAIKLNLGPKQMTIRNMHRAFDDEAYNDISVKYVKDNAKVIISEKTNYKIISRLDRFSLDDPIEVKANEFLIGPLIEEDHGNWVLSVFYKDIDDQWVEVFQVITIEILEVVPTLPHKPHLKPGDTFNLSFAYPIEGLISCELTAPRTTFDRFYNRSMSAMKKCGYTVPNITKEDLGNWKIVGVARIVYEAHTYLTIDD